MPRPPLLTSNAGTDESGAGENARHPPQKMSLGTPETVEVRIKYATIDGLDPSVEKALERQRTEGFCVTLCVWCQNVGLLSA